MEKPNKKIVEKIEKEIQTAKKNKDKQKFASGVKKFIVYLEDKKLTTMEKANLYILKKVTNMTEEEKKKIGKEIMIKYGKIE